MKVMRKIIEIDEELCDGCGNCVTDCAEGALAVINGTARVIADKFCDGLGACIGGCPQNALKIIEREAEDFDEAAVEEHLARMAADTASKRETLPCGCPSTQIRDLAPAGSCQEANKPQPITTAAGSALTHWPIKIRLIPPHAPFLKGADLLVLADCVGAAFPNVHTELLAGKVVMMGCPKFDEVQDYIERFARIFTEADIKTITAVVMEVPCCSGLPIIVQKGLEKAGKTVPMEEVVISARGKVLKRQ